jgi:hypothetical protein
MNVVGAFFSTTAILTISILIIKDIARTHELPTPWSLFLIFSLFDLYIPGLLYQVTGPPTLPFFMASLDDGDLIHGQIVFAVGIAFFAVGYFGFAKNLGRVISSKAHRKDKNALSVILEPKNAYILLIICIMLYSLSLYFDIMRAGSIDAYLMSKFLVRWAGKGDESADAFDAMFQAMSATCLNTIFIIIGILFYHRKTFKKELQWGILLPIIGWGFTLLTFFRGTQLVFFINLLILEVLRIKEENSFLPIAEQVHYLKLTVKKTVGISVVAILLFFSYGTIRAYNSQLDMGHGISGVAALGGELENVFYGAGLISLSSILANYPGHAEYLNGKTFVDMLLLPVPRTLYPSKPDWYGVDEITRGMGWAECKFRIPWSATDVGFRIYFWGIFQHS